MDSINIGKPLLAFTFTFVLVMSFVWAANNTTYGHNQESVFFGPFLEDYPAELEENIEHEEPENPYIIPITEEEFEWFAKLVSAESRGESLEGQIAVANVVLNRVSSPLFPNTIMEVIFQKGQFCPVRNGSIHKEPTEQSIQAVEMALRGHRVVPEDVLYFYAPSMVSQKNWIRTRKVVMQIGVHAFATNERGR